MPEFTLDAIDTLEVDTFTRGYITAIFFTDGEEADGAGVPELSPETLESIKTDCDTFQHEGGMYYESGEQAGVDFWLTRNCHGTGFWDNEELYGVENARHLTELSHTYPERSLFLNDDGRLTLESA